MNVARLPVGSGVTWLRWILAIRPHYEQLVWEKIEGMRLGNLNGAQDIWYERVLGSTTIEAPDEQVPDIESFVSDDGLRKHLADSLELYQNLLEDS